MTDQEDRLVAEGKAIRMTAILRGRVISMLLLPDALEDRKIMANMGREMSLYFKREEKYDADSGLWRTSSRRKDNRS